MAKTRYALIYGMLVGAVVIAAIIGGMAVGGFAHSVWFGYLVMLVALVFIFVGVKRYRDVECGGVVRFWPALVVALGIATVAGISYVAVWELYLALTHYNFIDSYAAGVIRDSKAHGVSGPALARVISEMDALRANYQNPLWRMGMTFSEMLPVSFPVALFSAALLRNPRLFPAKR